MHLVYYLSGNAPYFIILLFLTSDDFTHQKNYLLENYIQCFLYFRHAGYSYCGGVGAHSYKQFDPKTM
jgi:predicted class III extradiol MEMO1 family dioxygenase